MPAGGLVPPQGPQLLRVALLGTRQSGEPIPAFPTTADTPEQQLLLAAGTLAGPVFGTVQDLVSSQARATAVAIIGPGPW